MGDERRRIRDALFELYERHRRSFWTLHSLWALATGLLVVVLAHERYDFAVWVVAFLAVTWLSTLFFSRARPRPPSRRARLGREIVSYVTRVLYQETLFFLLPFYFYSTTLDSANVAFLALLVLLAILACLDLVFDRLLRDHRWFGLLFFAIVTFASLNLLLPIVGGLRLELATPIAAVIGLGAAVPMVYRPREILGRRVIVTIALASLASTVLLLWARALLPPVPLQLQELVFARDVRSEDLEPMTPLPPVPGASDGPANRLAAVASIFAPRRLRVRVELVWRHDGVPLKRSRELEVAPHETGFRVWDAFRSTDGPLPAGTYVVAVRTTGGQLVGRRALRVGS